MPIAQRMARSISALRNFRRYGKLAHLDMAGLQAGARVAQDEYDKENMADFALWKGWTEGGWGCVLEFSMGKRTSGLAH